MRATWILAAAVAFIYHGDFWFPVESCDAFPLGLESNPVSHSHLLHDQHGALRLSFRASKGSYRDAAFDGPAAAVDGI